MKQFLLALAALALPLAAPATPKPLLTAADSAARRSFVIDSLNHALHYQQGHITLPGGISELEVPRGMRYLDSAQSRTVLTQYWHNPDGSSLGMLFPANLSPLDETAWAYVIEYDPSGHVKDDDADDINYDDLLKEMRDDLVDANKERTAAGYSTVTLEGWASPPTPCTGPKPCTSATAPTTPSTTTCVCWAARACSSSTPWARRTTWPTSRPAFRGCSAP